MKQAYYRFITGESDGMLSKFLRWLLTPLQWLYATVIWVRNGLYDSGLFRVRRLPCLVISVGNIVVGGTGKTPAVIAIARQLQQDGVRVAILLRGYKRHVREKVTVVSDGENMCSFLIESGDEADMMARHLTGIPIIVGKQRYLTGKLALARFKSQVLILDDGFQHRQLHRDIEIVTLNATRPDGTGQLLPTGTLREPLSALRRADILLFTQSDVHEVSPAAPAAFQRFAPNTRVLETVHRPVKLYRLEPDGAEGLALPFDFLRGQRLLVVCGIGNPSDFAATLARYAPESVELMAFRDHHVYSEADYKRIHESLKETRSTLIVTTQKDEQKLAPFADKLPIAVFAVTLVFTAEGEPLWELIRQRFTLLHC